MDMIMASGKFGVKIKKRCQRVLNGEELARGMENECCCSNLLRKGGCDGLSSIQKSKAVGARNENCGESTGEQNKRIGSDR